MTKPYNPIYAKDGYEIITPDRICAFSLKSIEHELSPQQRAFLTMVLRGYDAPNLEHWAAARENLMRIGYRPASEELTKPARKARKGIGTF